jgi:protein-tyrosine-phosphatase
MAEAILAGMLVRRGVAAEVCSAGLLEGGRPIAPEAFGAVENDDPTMAHRLSRTLTFEEISRADLVLGMAREHVREVVVLAREAWGYTFTLKELVRRGTVHGGRGVGEPLCSWLAELSTERRRSDLQGAAACDDVADPMGGSSARLAATAAELRELCRQLVDLLGG